MASYDGGGSSPVQGKVTPAAIALLVVGILTVLWGFWLLGNGILNVTVRPSAPPGASDEYKLGQAMGGPIGLVLSLFTLGASGVIIAGALKMWKLQSYSFAMAATIISLVPCMSPCCVVGIPFGIWALVILMQQDVKAAFR